MKLTNQQIKEAYEREGGPELHQNRAKDTGLTDGDMIKSFILFFSIFALLVWWLT